MAIKNLTIKKAWYKRLHALNQAEKGWVMDKLMAHAFEDKHATLTEINIGGVSDSAFVVYASIVTELDAEILKESKAKRIVFNPPTLEEVTNYIKEKGFSVDPVQWWNFYNSKGWMVGGNKMKCWHSAVATWARGGNQYRNKNGYRGQQDLVSKVNAILAD